MGRLSLRRYPLSAPDQVTTLSLSLSFLSRAVSLSLATLLSFSSSLSNRYAAGHTRWGGFLYSATHGQPQIRYSLSLSLALFLSLSLAVFLALLLSFSLAISFFSLSPSLSLALALSQPLLSLPLLLPPSVSLSLSLSLSPSFSPSLPLNSYRSLHLSV